MKSKGISVTFVEKSAMLTKERLTILKCLLNLKKFYVVKISTYEHSEINSFFYSCNNELRSQQKELVTKRCKDSYNDSGKNNAK